MPLRYVCVTRHIGVVPPVGRIVRNPIKGLVLAAAVVALVAGACTRPTSTSSSAEYQCTGDQDPAGPVYNNVPYGASDYNRADIYPACTATAVGTILYVHGGGYSGGTKAEARHPNIQRLRDLGWVVVSINYRLTPFSMWPAQGNDVHSAVDWWRTTGASDFAAPAGPLIGSRLVSRRAPRGTQQHPGHQPRRRRIGVRFRRYVLA